MSDRYCVIMGGGVGSRFWPYSRADRPKQFIDFFGMGRSLLQMTYDRAARLVPKENIIVVTNEAYAPLVREHLPDLGSSQLLLEPARRNTAPCVAWAAYHILALNPNASIMVTPSDHIIFKEDLFKANIEAGFDFVESHDALLTLGIKPTRPETGYGYVQIGEPTQSPDILKVKTFTEKPNLDLAKVFLESGEFFWNSGIFLWSARSIISAMKATAPGVCAIFDNAAGVMGTSDEVAYINDNFPSCPNISIDFAVMEKASNVYVLCVNFGWNDLGTWSVLYDYSPKGRDGNVAQNCKAQLYNCRGNMIAAPREKLVVLSGLEDYIVADSGDVLLVCPKSEEQKIKQYVNDARASFGDKYL